MAMLIRRQNHVLLYSGYGELLALVNDSNLGYSITRIVEPCPDVSLAVSSCVDFHASVEVQRQCRLNSSNALSEPDQGFVIRTTNTPDRDLITIFQKGSRFSSAE